MPRNPNTPCAGCGKLCWPSKKTGDPSWTAPADHWCRECRQVPGAPAGRTHGKRSTYRTGCRCPSCTAAQTEYMRKFYRERGGNRRPSRKLDCAGGCGRKTRRSATGDQGTCRACLGRAKFTKRQRDARRKLRTAARGTASVGAWCQGECVECGEWFTRKRQPSPFCSGACGSKSRRKWITRADRLSIYARDGLTCQICFEVVDLATHFLDDWSATLDHIIPRSKGGSDEPTNLRLAHRWCNSVRGDETFYTDADLAA